MLTNDARSSTFALPLFYFPCDRLHWPNKRDEFFFIYFLHGGLLALHADEDQEMYLLLLHVSWHARNCRRRVELLPGAVHVGKGSEIPHVIQRAPPPKFFGFPATCVYQLHERLYIVRVGVSPNRDIDFGRLDAFDFDIWSGADSCVNDSLFAKCCFKRQDSTGCLLFFHITGGPTRSMRYMRGPSQPKTRRISRIRTLR